MSVITAGELQSLALRNQWGSQRLNALEKLLNAVPLLEIDAELRKSYAEVENYSQGTLMNKLLPKGLTARNMGKNDIWLAATALFYDLTFCTSDPDFDHLTGLGLRIEQYGI